MTGYDLLNYIGALSVVVFNFLHIQERSQFPKGRLRLWAEKMNQSGKYQIIFNDGVWLAAEILIICIVQYGPAPIINKIFGNIVGTGSNYFGLLYITPIAMLLGCYYLKVDPRKQMDIITPAFPLALFFAKLGCFLAKCCEGRVWSGGFQFPIQLLEALVALGLFIFLLIRKKKMKSGTMFPVYLILYSAIRFFTEFLRIEENIFAGLKKYHFLCMIGILLGIIEYSIVLKIKSDN